MKEISLLDSYHGKYVLGHEENLRYFVICYIKNNELHRGSDKPARMVFNKNGLKCEEWYYNGYSCRNNKMPSKIIYNNIKNYREFFYHGALFYEFMPYYVKINGDDDIVTILWSIRDITDKILNWLSNNNITLSINNNFEIPDDYKSEFKLRFM